MTIKVNSKNVFKLHTRDLIFDNLGQIVCLLSALWLECNVKLIYMRLVIRVTNMTFVGWFNSDCHYLQFFSSKSK